MSCWSTSFEWPAGLDDRRPAPKALRPPGSEWLTNLVMNVHAAGLLIGRGGKRIKMLQEDSGVQIQVHELDSSQRLLELRGPPVELQDGLELLITELARIPEALAPKGTQILVPERLRVASDAAVVAGPCEGEQLLVIEGSVPARTTAAAAVTALVARHLYRVGQVAPHRLQVVASAKTPLVATNTRAANLIPSYFRDDVLEGRVALITGGGSGIGFEVARQFGLHGCKGVVLMGRRKQFLDKAVELLKKDNIQAVCFAGDVRNSENCSAAVALAVETYGGLDVLVNAAAGNFLAAAEEISGNGFKAVMDIDAVGTFNVTRAAFEALRQSPYGGGKEISWDWIPARRAGTKGEIASACIYLCLNRYITGQTLPVDGGEWFGKKPMMPREDWKSWSAQRHIRGESGCVCRLCGGGGPMFWQIEAI
eukprot:g26064.t1